MLEELRRQLDKILQYTRAGEPFVGDLRQQPVQPMTEFVKQRADVVGGKERRVAGRRLGEIVVVDDDRQYVAVDARLAAIGVHPRAATLGRPREVIAQEDADGATVAIAHLEAPHIVVIETKIRPRDEANAKQPLRAIERRIEHSIERKIRLDRGFIEVVARLADFLRVVAPVPRFDHDVLAARQRHRPERVAFRCGAGLGGLPNLRQQRRHGARRLRHPVGERVIGIVCVTEQTRLFGSERENLTSNRTIVACALVFAAANPCVECPFAQIAPIGESQERHDQRSTERNHPGVSDPAGAGRFAGGVAYLVR